VEREGYQWDVGGQWLGPAQTRMHDLCAELGLATFAQYTQGAPSNFYIYLYYLYYFRS
jgi:monoamine oxidase